MRVNIGDVVQVDGGLVIVSEVEKVLAHCLPLPGLQKHEGGCAQARLLNRAGQPHSATGGSAFGKSQDVIDGEVEAEPFCSVCHR